MMRFWSGETVRIRVLFSTEAGEPMAATGVTITLKDPDGVIVAGNVVEGSNVGSFHADVEVVPAGIWAVRAHCSGPTSAVEEERFEVQQSYVV